MTQSRYESEAASLLDALTEEAREEPIEPGPNDDALVARAVLAGRARHRAHVQRRVAVVVTGTLALAAAVALAWTAPVAVEPVQTASHESPTSDVLPHDVAPAVSPTVEPAAVELVELTLPTGDRLTATADARFDVESSRAALRIVRMHRGAMLFDVAPLGDGSRFEVHTPDARVRVLGTVFAVEVNEHGTSVRLYEGSVEILRSGAPPVVLVAGAQGADVSDGVPASGSVRLEALDAAGHIAARERAARAGEVRAHAATASRETSAPSIAPRTRPAHADEEAAPAPETDARQRLSEADTLRGLGRASEAADAYEDAAHRLEGVSALTPAFLAAELRMRRLHDPAAAVRVLDETNVDAVGSPLRERGLALRADALGQLGQYEALRAVAHAYLAEHPTGPHADAMRRHLVEHPAPRGGR